MAAATFHGLRKVSPNLPKFGGNQVCIWVP
jgi:hypothetical protein